MRPSPARAITTATGTPSVMARKRISLSRSASSERLRSSMSTKDPRSAGPPSKVNRRRLTTVQKRVPSSRRNITSIPVTAPSFVTFSHTTLRSTGSA